MTAIKRTRPEDRCSPLCGADRAYGPRVQWWQHDALCPRRQIDAPDQNGSIREASDG